MPRVDVRACTTPLPVDLGSRKTERRRWTLSCRTVCGCKRLLMQTFLPYPDFAKTAAVLDPRRLGKQRVEAMQILRALTRPVYGWKHHPAVLMWAGYEEALGSYAVVICREWCRRGHADTCEATIMDDLAAANLRVPPRAQAALASAGALPSWLGDDAVHRSHRSALLRKAPDWYTAAFGDVPDDLPYVWPVRSSTT